MPKPTSELFLSPFVDKHEILHHNIVQYSASTVIVVRLILSSRAAQVTIFTLKLVLLDKITLLLSVILIIETV